MIREAGMWALAPEAESEFTEYMNNYAQSAARALNELGVQNASVWRVNEFVFGYRELPDGYARTPEMLRYEAEWQRGAPGLTQIGAPGSMRLMYYDYGVIRANKRQIRRRVFATRLKPGCAEEYKARHQALIAARGAEIKDGAESNFTIWCARDEYIFGYCELVRAFDRPPDDTQREATRAWETRQLEIMDWLTDDVDWLTGETHARMQCIFIQQGYEGGEGA